MAPASNIDKTVAAVLKRITPSDAEKRRVLPLAKILVKKVEEAAKEAKVKAEVRVEGSVAKDTWLKHEPDIDIFLQLPTSIPREELGTICLGIARQATKGSKQVERFAEHPYLEAFVDGTRVNIVPCYKTKRGEWMSATDRTPYHTDFIRPRLSDEMRSEIRLLKQFMKGVGVYGAEIKVGGFSGYLCELLALRFGTFASVLQTASNWRKPWIIDYMDYYKDREDEISKIFSEPLVVIDPVDKGRNVASAVREQRLVEFIAASRQFLQHPAESFFFPARPKPVSQKQLFSNFEKRGTALVFVKVGRVKAVPDILWGQLYRTQRSLCNMLSQNSFHVVNDAVWSSEDDLSVLLFEVEHRCLPHAKKHSGPPIDKRVECERFLKKHLGARTTVSGPRLEDQRWVVHVRRRYVDVVELLRSELKHGGRQVGVAGLVSKAVRRNMEILVDQEIADIYKVHTDFAEFLTGYIDGRPRWLKAS